MSNLLMGTLTSYWGIIIVLIGYAILFIFQRKTAEKLLLGLMLQVEKSAEALTLQTGDEKFKYVCDKGYELMPSATKLLISKGVFINLAMQVYDKAKSYLEVLDITPSITAPEPATSFENAVDLGEVAVTDPVAVDSIVADPVAPVDPATPVDPVAPVAQPSAIQSVIDAATVAGQVAYNQVVQDSIQALSVTK